jgi:hypothetical protein
MRFPKLTMFMAIGVFLAASLQAFAESVYSSSGNGFSVFSGPVPAYTNGTYLYAPTDPNSTIITWLGPFYFSNGLTVLPVPPSWPTLDCYPPDPCTAHVLATRGDSLTIKIEDYDPSGAGIVGFDLQPISQHADEIVVDFFSGSTHLGTIDQFVNGSGGPQLFAAARTSYYYSSNGQPISGMPFTSVQITDLSGNSFAIGELRAAPEPSAAMTLGSGLLTLVILMRRKLLV